LDKAVFAAYGWKTDLSDSEIVSRLLALNLERAGKERATVPPEYPVESVAHPVNDRNPYSSTKQ
jgi:hypothetical protein